VHVGRDQTIAVRCHACGATGDALSLVAAAHGLEPRRDFVEVCTIAAELAGRWDLVDELTGKTERRPAPAPKPRPEPLPERDYPPIDEVHALLRHPAWDDADACAYLCSRAIDPERLELASVGVRFAGVDVGAVAYALDRTASLPRWARYQGRPWTETGHRLLVPMVDAAGELRSVRAIRVVHADTPKRLPPSGHRASGLVMASELAVGLLRGTWRPAPDAGHLAVRVVEGEPDYLSALCVATMLPTAVIGVVSGSWSEDIARRIPSRALVAIQTHDDEAGERYAVEVGASLEHAGVHVIARVKP
jgi:hypothetical protein